MPLRQQITERLFLLSVAAAVLMAADLAVKATVPTSPWHFHQRSNAWEVLCVVLLFGALALARIPSRAVAIGAGVMSGGVAGNLLSARANDNRVPNPLVVGDYMIRVQRRRRVHPHRKPAADDLADGRHDPPSRALDPAAPLEGGRASPLQLVAPPRGRSKSKVPGNGK
jgi:hypothetical protein